MQPGPRQPLPDPSDVLAALRTVHTGRVFDLGVDLGPNLSVTGSLATILWLAALRREGLHMGALTFLKIGAVVMLPALILSLATLALI